MFFYKLTGLIILFISIAVGQEVISPIPKSISYNHQKAILGKKLFFDPKLSSNGEVACISCHNPLSGADTKAYSIGVGGEKGNANAPTVFNSVFNFCQTWSGGAKYLKAQVSMPIHNPVEMNMKDEKIDKYLQKEPYYSKEFEKIYHKEANFNDMADAIAEFEKALITPNSKFDRYLRGETKLSSEEKKGYKLFKTLGCITCHNGINMGGNSFQKFGLINPYPWNPKAPDRYSVTHNPLDKNVYKVPTLRNIELTAPYFHNGNAKTLKKAIKDMAYYNLGYPLSDEEIDALVYFLKTLTGNTPKILQQENR